MGIFWAYSAALYLDVIYFPWPLPYWYAGTSWMLDSGLPLGLARSAASDVAAVVIFATYPLWFFLGTELGKAGHRLTRAQRVSERDRIVRELADAEYPPGGAIPPGAADVGTAAAVESLLARIPPLFADALTLLLFVFDSRFFVLVFTGKWKRFVDLDPKEKVRYMDVWESNSFLVSMAQMLRIAVSYGYFTKQPVYAVFDYNGPMAPDLPPWYKAGPTEVESRP